MVRFGVKKSKIALDNNIPNQYNTGNPKTGGIRHA